MSIEERYEFAAKIVRLTADLKVKLYGSDFFTINWNAVVINGYTDSLEELVLKDIFAFQPASTVPGVIDEVRQEARDRIRNLFHEYRLLVAELELSGLRYGQSGPN